MSQCTKPKSKRAGYPAYKPSGVEWLGKIPSHWSITPVKRQYEIQLGKMLQNKPESDDDVSVPYVKALHVMWGKVSASDLPEMWASPADVRRFSVTKGDLLVCEGGEAGRAGIVDSIPDLCIIQNALHRVRGQGSDVHFLQYVLQAVGSAGWFDVLCNKATIAHFTREKLSELPMPLPPNLSEQRAIAAFLDRETARIDALIEKKQRQIELLQEKRSALISHAVTKGLDPNAPTKESGIEWLGEIPQHWEVKQIKHLGAIRYGLGETLEYVDDGLSFIRATDIKQGKIEMETARKVRHEDVPWNRRPTLQLDEILVVRSGAYTGDSAIVSGNVVGCIAGYDMVLTITRAHSPFVAWVLLSKYMLHGQIYLERMRAAQPHLNAEELGGFIILLPPLMEQQQIAKTLASETKELDVLTNKISGSIELLREYRTSLVSAAVTGKIDVREELV
jgi:type I restriction enzyme S subunit